MSQRAKRKRTVSVTEDAEAVFTRRKKEPERENVEKKFAFRVLLPNGSHLTLTLEDPDEEMSVGNFIRAVARKYENGENDKGSRHIQWAKAYLEDTLGNKIKDGKIIPLAAVNKIATIILQDGGIDTVHAYQDLWDVTPEPHLLGALPQDYSTETALADLIDNSLQAVWANALGERRLISVKIGNREISIFDSGQGMDGSKENSIAKWGTMGSSTHKAKRREAVGGRPPYLKPFFGMYGCGGVAASMYLGSVVMVSSKTKTSKKVVTLRLEKDSLVQRSKADRIWRTPGEIREVSQEEGEMSPHGSFTKVHISSLKSQYWDEDQLKCMLKDIYFPYIQNDGSDEAIHTSTPVEFEVNGTNLIEVEGGEVVATNLASCNAPPFVVELHFKCHPETDMKEATVVEEANAKLSFFYFPITQGKESIDKILENLESEKNGLGENFDKFCRVSIRHLGRLLPDARWGRLPFMEPKRRRTENALIPQQCYKRVKCFVDTDAGFVPTSSKTDLAHKHQFTLALKSLGRKPDASFPTVHVDIERDGKPLSLNHLDKEYQEWLKAMHESFDEEVECCDEQAVLILNPSNGRDLGISHNVMRVLSQIRRKGQLWKAGQRVKIIKGAPAGKDLYATLEYILCEGLEGDPGEARMICRPMECPEDMGSKVALIKGIACFELGTSKSFPMELISSGKCLAVDEDIWTKQVDKKRLKSPDTIEILNTEQVQKFDVDKGFDLPKGFPKEVTVKAGFDLPKEIIAIVRPCSFTEDSKEKIIDGTDQKYVVKDNMEMRMDIKDIQKHGSAPENSAGNNVKYTIQTRTSSRKGVHGLYCFSMEGSHLLEMFKKAGRYRFTFSLVNSSDANPLCVYFDLCVEASDEIGYWKLSNQLSESEGAEIKRLEGRLGSEIGPIYISCYDIYSNQSAFKIYPKIQIQVRKMGKPVGIEIESASGNLTPDKMHMQVKILLGGNLDKLRPSFEASLRVGIKEPCYADMPITVLPGYLSKVEIWRKQELDNCLRPENVIHDFEVQAMDTYGNAVEKGQRVKVELEGIKFQDQSDLYRKVDDQGHINFGGLLKVVGSYGSRGYIRISSESHSKILLEKHFQLLTRELKVISVVPEECYAGSAIDNLVFGIFDEKGQIDEEMTGRQHSLMIDLSPQDGVQYPFRKGKCTVPKLSFPPEPGNLEFTAFHSFHPELRVHLKIALLPCPPLAMVMLPEQGFDNGAVYQALDESVKLDPCSSNEINFDSKLRSTGESLLNNLKKWDEDLKRRGAKVGQHETKLSELQISLAAVEGEIEKLNSGSKGDDKIISNRGSHSVEQTMDEIKRQENSAAAAWVELASSHQLKLHQPPIFAEVIGVVALLGKVEDDLLSWVVSEYLGKENMLAIVCKSRKGVEQLEMHDPTGKLIPLSGIHGIANLQQRHIDGRFRVICLEDVRCYNGDIKSDDPQKQLVIENPKLLSGSIPNGFIDYAVNLIKLDPENQYSLAMPGVGLRETLFFNLLSYVQVYETRNDMMQAISCIQDGAISLDGGILKHRGIIECGNREEVAVRFPTTSSKGKTLLKECHLLIEEKLLWKMKEKKKLEDEIRRTKIALDKSRKKVNAKCEEISQLEKEYTSLNSLLKPDILKLGSS